MESNEAMQKLKKQWDSAHQAAHQPSSAAPNASQTEMSEVLERLRAALSGGEPAFVQAIQDVCRESFSAATHTEAVRLALQAGAHGLARTLAAEGSRKYPDDPELAKMARILAPSELLDVTRPVDPSVSLNQAWLREHAKGYRGRWIALRAGQLVADAPTAKELKALLDDRTNLLVTRIA